MTRQALMKSMSSLKSMTSLKPRSVVYLDPQHSATLMSSSSEDSNLYVESTVTRHAFLKYMCPSCFWTSIIGIKRCIPRMLYIPIVFLLSAGLFASVVVPVTVLYNKNAAAVTKDRFCYGGPIPNGVNMSGGIYGPALSNASNPYEQLGDSYLLSSQAIATLRQAPDGSWVPGTKCPKGTATVSQAETFWYQLPNLHQAYIAEAESRLAVGEAEFLKSQVPDLMMLALCLRLTTAGNFDPIDGTLGGEELSVVFFS